MGVFRDMFPQSAHVFSLRDPQKTWESQKARRNYFFAKLLYLFSEAQPNRMRHLFPELADLTLFERLRVNRTFKRKISHISDDRVAPLFWEAYAGALLNGVLYADFILDLALPEVGHDDRLALGQYLDHLPARGEGASIDHGLKALTQWTPAARPNGTNTLSYCRTPSLDGQTAKLLRNRHRLRQAACMAGPKLAAANREILSNLVSEREPLAGHTQLA